MSEIDEINRKIIELEADHRNYTSLFNEVDREIGKLMQRKAEIVMSQYTGRVTGIRDKLKELSTELEGIWGEIRNSYGLFDASANLFEAIETLDGWIKDHK